MKPILIQLDFPPSRTTHQSGTRRLKSGMSFKTKELQSLESLYAAALLPHKPTQPLQGPVSLWLVFTFPWRKSEPAKNRVRGRLFKDTTPDLDNLEKTLIDMLTKAGFWLNDGQIAHKVTSKFWGHKPGINIQIQPSE